MRVCIRWFFVSCILLSTMNCADLGKRSRRSISHYSEDARRSFEEAMTAYKDRDWLEATSLFREVRRKFDFSVYAPLAQLRLADIEYEQEKWIEALGQYKAFVRENPRHVDVAWARMRTARCYYNQISDSFFLPNQEERDQSSILEATREIKDYILNFPDGPEVKEMQKLEGNVLARLVSHELYVARYYMRKDRPEAALGRVNYAIEHYQGSKRDVEVLLIRGEILLMLKRIQEARATFSLILKRHGNDPYAVQAQKFIDKLNESP